ncbi:MAG TPA: YciI family protein [Nevskia sp.]|jgi:hypothetical protein|nr:YciI family protein [Nevskia sp.]
MKYVLLIHLPAGAAGQITEAQEQNIQDVCHVLTEDVRGKDQYRGSMRLAPEEQAVSLQLKAGKHVVVDGPFAETKEFLAGIYVIECDSVDEAVAYARRHPGAAMGTVEIRPLVFMETG